MSPRSKVKVRQASEESSSSSQRAEAKQGMWSGRWTRFLQQKISAGNRSWSRVTAHRSRAKEVGADVISHTCLERREEEEEEKEEEEEEEGRSADAGSEALIELLHCSSTIGGGPVIITHLTAHYYIYNSLRVQKVFLSVCDLPFCYWYSFFKPTFVHILAPLKVCRISYYVVLCTLNPLKYM